MHAALAIRGVRLLWLSQLASWIGDWAGRLAVAGLVYQRTHSPALTAIVTAVTFLPYVVGPWLVAALSAEPPRRTLVATDLARAALFALLIVRLPVAAVLLITFLAALVTPLFEATRAAVMPQICGEEHVGATAALTQVTTQTAIVVGGLTGGALLTTVGPRSAVALNAISFLVSGALLRGLPSLPAPPPVGRVRSAPKATLRSMRETSVVAWSAGLAVTVASCMVAGEALVVVYAKQHDQDLLPLLAAVTPAVAALTSVVVPTTGSSQRLIRTAAFTAVLGSGCAATLLFLGGPALVGVCAFAVLGICGGAFAPTQTAAVTGTEPAARASMFALVQAGLMIGQAAVATAAGLLAERIGSGAAIGVALLPATAVSLVALWRFARPLAGDELHVGGPQPIDERVGHLDRL